MFNRRGGGGGDTLPGYDGPSHLMRGTHRSSGPGATTLAVAVFAILTLLLAVGMVVRGNQIHALQLERETISVDLSRKSHEASQLLFTVRQLEQEKAAKDGTIQSLLAEVEQRNGMAKTEKETAEMYKGRVADLQGQLLGATGASQNREAELAAEKSVSESLSRRLTEMEKALQDALSESQRKDIDWRVKYAALQKELTKCLSKSGGKPLPQGTGGASPGDTQTYTGLEQPDLVTLQSSPAAPSIPPPPYQQQPQGQARPIPGGQAIDPTILAAQNGNPRQPTGIRIDPQDPQVVVETTGGRAQGMAQAGNRQASASADAQQMGQTVNQQVRAGVGQQQMGQTVNQQARTGMGQPVNPQVRAGGGQQPMGQAVNQGMQQNQDVQSRDL